MLKDHSPILVTGGCGFVGSELTSQLLAQGYEVVVADDLSNPQSQVKDGYKFYHVDVGDREKSKDIFKEISACIALASVRGAIGFVDRNPAEVLSGNNSIFNGTFLGSVHAGVKRIIYISSSMVYASCRRFPTTEEMISMMPVPQTVFGLSKLMGEGYCRSFYKEYGLEYTIIRPSNIYGSLELPGKKAGDTHVIPELCQKILTSTGPIELLGNGKQTRCFIHVKDLVSGIITALESEEAINEDFNMGHPDEITIEELARKLCWYCTGQNSMDAKFLYKNGFAEDVQRQRMDISKAKQRLGWEPHISLDEGLREVVENLKKRLQ